MAKRGLGKGLDALFQSYDEVHINDDDISGEIVREIKISEIDPNINQPRKVIDEEKIRELANSIKEHGIVQPIIVKKENGRYTLVAGERRWRAARIAGLHSVPAIVRDLDKQEIMEIALIENLQREDLNPIEEALGVKALIEKYGLTQEQVADRLGKSRPAIANSIRLLMLSKEIQQYIIDQKLSPGHARALLAIDDEKTRKEIAEKIIKEGLSVRETEKYIQKIKNEGNGKDKNKPEKPTYIIEIEGTLEESLGTRVIINPGKKKGVIEIEYYNNEDLERIIEKIAGK